MKKNIDLTLNRDFEKRKIQNPSFNQIITSSKSFSNFDLSELFDSFFEDTPQSNTPRRIPKINSQIEISDNEFSSKFPLGSINQIKRKNRIIKRSLLIDDCDSCDRCGSLIPAFYDSTLCKVCDKILLDEFDPSSAHSVFYKK